MNKVTQKNISLPRFHKSFCVRVSNYLIIELLLLLLLLSFFIFNCYHCLIFLSSFFTLLTNTFK